MDKPRNEFLNSLKKARSHLEKKEYPQARKMYFHAYNHTRENKNRAIIWSELSWVYYYESDFEKAIEAAENVLINDSNYQALDDLYRVMGFSYLARGDQALAERYLTLSVEHSRDEEKIRFVRFELGKMYFVRGAYDLAYNQLKHLEDDFRDSEQAYHLSVLFYLGFIHYYLEQPDKARTYFNEILAGDPDDQRRASGFFGLAFIEFQQKNYLNVISLCERIMTLDRHFFDTESVAFLTAASYHHLGRKDIFDSYYQEMIKTFPDGRYRKELDRLHMHDKPNKK